MAKQLLDDNLKKQLGSLVPRITEDVELVYSLDERPQSEDLEQLLTDIASLSEKITARRDDDAHPRQPSFSINRVGSDIGVTFAGIPMGHEFSSLVLALLQVGGNPIKEEQDLIDQVKNLDGDYEFVTYMSLTCQNCPTVVQALNTMAVLNPRIKHTAVEGSLFQDEVKDRNVLAVPTIYLNGEEFGQGRTTIEDFVRRLDEGAGAREAEKLNEKEPYEVLVVGQGPAGAAAAIYVARKGLRVGLVGERFGGQVLDTNAIENFVSVPYTEGPQLGAALEDHARQYEIDIIKAQSATSFTAAAQPGGGVDAGEDALHTVHFGDGALKAREVIVATGAQWRTLGVPGEDEYRNKGVTFCPHCDGPLFKGKSVAVIGGGNSGIEAALDLAGVVKDVTVLEFGEACRADDVLMDKVEATSNISVITSAATTEIVGDGKNVTGLTYTDRTTDESKSVDVAGVFIQIGLVPNTKWLADSGVELNTPGEIVTDRRGATNVPGVFGAGDCTDVPFKQIIVAEGSGATAGLSAWEFSVTGGKR
ncbi:alkyl hydroperoxide reductase subunit F [Corynebacterium sp. zg254]|uniref:Alkyl hydroperoxide reductase subunit F n=1 Tax=Corynebacterium zhongnanshanii TaxID=2768834 RepID=A0ABQ6VD14_9CORY|nr:MULTISPECIES: alkyl hydroperoxide reductase subunit F [Corynebacterium]KAB3519983.1 alkyl hydroperoxide reductase subunit F [Corynebacterium zhongnanshanii]MCR5914933.1 alkyl hydroperoxide reductase subunit F [Corynebacterium sp. zg254]